MFYLLSRLMSALMVSETKILQLEMRCTRIVVKKNIFIRVIDSLKIIVLVLL